MKSSNQTVNEQLKQLSLFYELMQMSVDYCCENKDYSQHSHFIRKKLSIALAKNFPAISPSHVHAFFLNLTVAKSKNFTKDILAEMTVKLNNLLDTHYKPLEKVEDIKLLLETIDSIQATQKRDEFVKTMRKIGFVVGLLGIASLLICTLIVISPIAFPIIPFFAAHSVNLACIILGYLTAHFFNERMQQPSYGKASNKAEILISEYTEEPGTHILKTEDVVKTKLDYYETRFFDHKDRQDETIEMQPLPSLT